KQLRRLDTTLDEEDLAKLMGFDAVEEFFAALGNGTVSPGQVISKLTAREVKPEEKKDVVVPLPLPGATSGMEVLGVGDLLTRMARCCNPIGGDRIIGYITRGRGVTVHRATCPNVLHES